LKKKYRYFVRRVKGFISFERPRLLLGSTGIIDKEWIEYAKIDTIHVHMVGCGRGLADKRQKTLKKCDNDAQRAVIIEIVYPNI